MKIGKFYQSKELYWFLYSSKEYALDLGRTYTVPAGSAIHAAVVALYTSERYQCSVSYIEPNSPYILLEQIGKLHKLLTANGEIGWIYVAEHQRPDIEEVNQ
jgi:hypothetical protein